MKSKINWITDAPKYNKIMVDKKVVFVTVIKKRKVTKRKEIKEK